MRTEQGGADAGVFARRDRQAVDQESATAAPVRIRYTPTTRSTRFRRRWHKVLGGLTVLAALAVVIINELELTVLPGSRSSTCCHQRPSARRCCLRERWSSSWHRLQPLRRVARRRGSSCRRPRVCGHPASVHPMCLRTHSDRQPDRASHSLMSRPVLGSAQVLGSARVLMWESVVASEPPESAWADSPGLSMAERLAEFLHP